MLMLPSGLWLGLGWKPRRRRSALARSLWQSGVRNVVRRRGEPGGAGMIGRHLPGRGECLPIVGDSIHGAPSGTAALVLMASPRCPSMRDLNTKAGVSLWLDADDMKAWPWCPSAWPGMMRALNLNKAQNAAVGWR